MQQKKEIVSSAHAMVNRLLNSVVVLVRLVVYVRYDAVVAMITIDYHPPPPLSSSSSSSYVIVTSLNNGGGSRVCRRTVGVVSSHPLYNPLCP